MANKKSKIEIELAERAVQMEKAMAIMAEVEASFKFIKLGLLDLRSLNEVVSNNHVALQMLSSGFERLIKILILLKEKHTTGSFPALNVGKSFFRKYKGGHGIDVMLEELLVYSEGVPEMSANEMVKEDMLFLKEDKDFLLFMHLLTEFSIVQRYFYIDTIVIEKENPEINPFKLFTNFIYGFLKGIDQSQMSYKEADTLAIKMTISCVEKGVRGISRFFTHGFRSLGRQYYADFSSFILLRDEDLGEIKYAEPSVAKSERYVPIKKGSLKYFKLISLSKTKVLKSSDFAEWTFDIDKIKIIYAGGILYLAEIGNEIFALTTHTSNHFEIPNYFKSKHLKPRAHAIFLMDEAKKLNSKG